ncbi:MAG: hypothetical protein ORN26_02225, partial [Candidatus Pacebacteria bacterium]|nr:hypothetical protein [Candidatus Paceibacterota bacterium]
SVLVAGSARAHIADFTFNGNNIITAVKLQRTGVSNNSVFNNVYLYDGANRVADGVSVSTDGTINWNYTGGLFQVSGSKVISVYADVASGTSGSTAGVALLGYTAQGSSSPVVLSPAIAGPVLSIGSVNLANVSFQGSAVTGGGINTVSQSTVTAGTPGVKV